MSGDELLGSDCVCNNIHSPLRGIIWATSTWFPDNDKFLDMFKKRGMVNYLILSDESLDPPDECVVSLFMDYRLSNDVSGSVAEIVEKVRLNVVNVLLVCDDLRFINIVLGKFPNINTSDFVHAINYICNVVGFSQLPLINSNVMDFDFEKYRRLTSSPYTYGESMAMLRDSIDVPFARVELVKRLWSIGTAASLNEAFAVCSRPDSQESSELRLFLARMYVDGIVVEPNVEMANAILMDVAFNEHPELCIDAVRIFFALGSAEYYSRGVALCKAYANKDVRLLLFLANEYFTGKHIKRDMSQAINYYSQAALSGADGGWNGLADALLNRRAEGDVEQASAILTRRSEIDPWATMRLARMYRDGVGFEKDLGKAINLFADAANRGVVQSKNEFIRLVIKNNIDCGDVMNLVDDPDYIYQNARKLSSDSTTIDEAINEFLKIIDVKPAAVNECADLLVKRNRKGDPEKAFSMVKAASDGGNLWAQGRVARFYRDGICVEADIDVAIGYMRLPAERGIKWARDEMVAMLMDRGNPEDLQEAFSFRQDGAYEEDGWNQIHLARMYRDGVGTVRDINKAILLMRSAARKDISQAKVELRRLLIERGLPEDKNELKKTA